MSNTQNRQEDDPIQPESLSSEQASAPQSPITAILRDRRSLMIASVLALAAILAILFAWRLPPFASAIERTENAYVRGQVTTMAPQLSGYVDEVLVQDFQSVEAGQELVRIDQRIYRQRLDQARATLAARRADLASARAQRTRAQADIARASDLAVDGSISLRERDQSRATELSASASVAQALAAVEAARASVQLAEIDLANTVIRAPIAGQLGQVSVRRGQYVTAGTQLLTLTPPGVWVIANFKERQVGRMRPGQRTIITVDALGDARLTGRVEMLSPATGSEFSLIPANNATGNFTKIAQRIPVRIAIDANQEAAALLRPGMSVVARVDTSSTGGVE